MSRTMTRAARVALMLVLTSAVPALASAQIAPGAAHGVAEAPGGTGLAGLPAEVAQANGAAASPEPSAPASERSMAFSARGGECRETVPGGTLLAVAYAVAIAVMGGYVAFLAWRNAQLARAIDSLEAQLAKKTGAKDTTSA